MKILKYALSGLVLLSCLTHSGFSQENITLSGEELFGNMRARHIGPALMSGRINDLENHPTNDKIIYAGSAGGGVWKSTNGGVSFLPIFDDHAQSIGVVRLSPHDPDNTIWVGTGETWTRNSVSVGDGLYKSADGGSNWQKVGFEKSERISSIEFHPDDPNTIYVGVLGALWSDSEERGIYKSTDGGQSWEQILYLNPATGCSDLIIDPQNPDTMYASMWEFRRTAWSFSSGGENSALYKSTDGGESWEKIHQGFPEGKLGRIALAMAPSDHDILYAVLETEKDEDKGLYRSDDGGQNWRHLNGDFGLVVRPFYFSRIVVDPRDPDVVVKAGLTGSISRDGGQTFKNLGSMHADIHDIVFDINNSDRMYVGTDGGVYRSWDGGNNLEIVENLPLSQFYHLALDDKEPYNVYGGLQDNGSWYGPSSSPGGVEARDWHTVGQGDGFRVLPHPTRPIVYSEMQGAERVWRYDTEKNQAKTIQPLATKDSPELRFNWNTPLLTSTHQPDRLYIGSQFLHKSEDMGDSWTIISPDLTTNDPEKQKQSASGGLSVDNSGAENHCTIFTVAESSLDEQLIWVGTDDGNVQITQDGGQNWTNTVDNIPGLPEHTWCYHIEASVHQPGTAYAVFDGHTRGDMAPYVYKTTDYGQSWTSLVTDEIYGFARSFQEDLQNPDLLFLGTEFGLFVSINGGENWSRFTNNMPAVAVHHMEMHPRTHDLVMATHGRGIIILDDISPLRQITPDVLAKDVHFFRPAPAVMPEESGFGGTAKETEFVGANPNPNARIVYYLKKRHLFGKMSMQIHDEAGEMVAEITPGKAKGINIVNWSYRTRQPKVAKGKTFAFGGLTAPRVQAGTYKVVLYKGKDTYETELEVVNDPNSLLTQAERDEHYRVTQRLFNMNEDLAYIVYELDTWLEQAGQATADDPKAEKVATRLSDRLTKLKEQLVVTTGDNYVGRAEPELREKITELYGKVASGYQPPSPAEMENLALLEEQLNQAREEFAAIKAKEGRKFKKYLRKKELEDIKIKTFEEFVGE